MWEFDDLEFVDIEPGCSSLIIVPCVAHFIVPFAAHQFPAAVAAKEKNNAAPLCSLRETPPMEKQLPVTLNES